MGLAEGVTTLAKALVPSPSDFELRVPLFSNHLPVVLGSFHNPAPNVIALKTTLNGKLLCLVGVLPVGRRSTVG
jgi:hypothetical protein